MISNSKGLLGRIKDEREHFLNDYVKLAGFKTKSGISNGFLSGSNDDDGYSFNQTKTLDIIDLYYNSRFESGQYDSYGQEKLFLNICKFRADVAIARTDIDTKDHVFVPADGYSVWGAYFMNKEFKQWSKQKMYGKLINELNTDRNKYGTAVVKIVGNNIYRVPIKTLINPQDADSLQSAFENGESVIEAHRMTYHEIISNKEWDTNGLEPFEGKKLVYERYGLVNEKEYFENGEDRDVKSISIVLIDDAKNIKKSDKEKILFIKRITDKQFPYLETSKNKQDGRWLGVGEIELQIPNQIARNIIVNLRKRSMQWSSKKIFQSRSDDVAKNLLRDVKDGDVIKIGATGDLQQINNVTQSLPDYNAAQQEWEQNSDQKSFTFEVSTGEALPSGTPFRLGVILSNAVNSHWNYEREEFGLFLKELLLTKVIPEFKKDVSPEHTYQVFGNDEDLEDLRELFIEVKVNEKVIEKMLKMDSNIDKNVIRAEIEDKLTREKSFSFKIPQQFYDNLKYSIDLVITGESIDVNKQLETSTTVLQLVSTNPDILNNPVTRRLLSKILATIGYNLTSFVGRIGFQQTQQQPQNVPQIVRTESPSLNQLAQTNSPDGG